MTRKSFATLGIVIVLLVSLVGTVAAQTGTTPTVTPTPTDDAAETSAYTHPIVQILAAYFGREAASETLTPVTATDTPTETATPDPNATETQTPTESVTGTDALAQEIETYHEDGMGFGVLVKLYAMAEAAKIACPTAPTTDVTPVPSDGTTTDGTTAAAPCTAVTVDQLVQEFKSGTGMGQLFKTYGKPSLLGVGQVKHALLEEQQQTTVEDGDETTLEDGSQTQLLPGNQAKNKLLKNNKVNQHANSNKGKKK